MMLTVSCLISQHLLASLSQFPWSTTSWLNFYPFHFVINQRANDCGGYISKDISQIDLLHTKPRNSLSSSDSNPINDVCLNSLHVNGTCLHT